MSADEAKKPTKKALVGGPGSALPFFVESLMGWSLAITCLSVSGYHYLVGTFAKPTLSWVQSRMNGRYALKDDENNSKDTLPCWLPLTTTSRSEMDRCTPIERYHQLVFFLKHLTPTKASLPSSSSWSDEELVQLIRSSQICRRLATLVMRPGEGGRTRIEVQNLDLSKQLVRIWPNLLASPPLGDDYDYKFDISLILPAFRERGSDIYTKMSRALESCRNPKRIQVVIVDAGACLELEDYIKKLKGWGEVKLITFSDGGGRGPCLNYGASASTGRLFTFCHSDTRLPPDWDVKVIKALCENHDNGTTRANSCAFSFGIDTSNEGLNGGLYPPGIKAVETTANIRSHLYSLPYGDQVISVPASVFNFLGGYPDQCLMEDYELVSLLRKRNALLPKFGILDREKLAIIGGPPALCSPRRWQKFGVLYVTFMNSKFVNKYACGMTPNNLFSHYYGGPPPKRSSELSPWENEMVEILQNS